MFKFKWIKKKKIDTDINNNKIGNVDNLNNSVNFKKINNSIVNFQNQLEIEKLKELSNLEIERNKIVLIFKYCNECLNSMYNELLKIIDLQIEFIENVKKNLIDKNYNYNSINKTTWKELETAKIKIIDEGLNFKICDKHIYLRNNLRELNIKIKNFKIK